MRYIVLSLGAAVLGTIILAACNSTPKASVTSQAQAPSVVQTDTTYADGVRRITIADANKLIKSGQAFVVDVRNQAAYDAGHIPGARLIPVGEILNHVNEMPRDKTIITYCS
jgi:3-mercaptopyruvate sulfurtransferase SseA